MTHPHPHPTITHTLALLLFGITLTTHLALTTPHHIHYQEQNQLFLYTQQYTLDILKTPGGLPDLIARFLTQFHIYAWAGATTIATIHTLILHLTYRHLRTHTLDPLAHTLAHIPALLSLTYLTNQDALLTLPISLLLTLLTLQLPLRRHPILILPAIITITYLLTPIHYHRTPTPPTLHAYSATLALLILTPIRYLRHRPHTPHHPHITHHLITLTLTLITLLTLHHLHTPQKENTMAYDYMARHAMWNAIIQRAQTHPPHNQITHVALALALAQRNQLPTYARQHPHTTTPQTLLPPFTPDHITPLVTAEAFYHLGLINTAQRYTFEAQEAIPDHQKSARCYKRLAETNLINGNYNLARKYLTALTHTWYYRKWAKQTLTILNDQAINQHPIYGPLRQLRPQHNYLFGGHTPQQILIQQLQTNPNNHLAQQYLQALTNQ